LGYISLASAWKRIGILIKGLKLSNMILILYLLSDFSTEGFLTKTSIKIGEGTGLKSQ
jgi:hypothetical protein